MPFESAVSLLARRALLLGLLSALGACNHSDNVAGPDSDPPGPPTIQQFVISDTDVVHGGWIQIQWKIAGAERASIDPDVGSLSTLQTGAVSVRPAADATYTLTAANDLGSTTATVSVTVTYRGIYVSSVGGDDANTGDSPAAALASLQEAFARTGGGALFVAGGTYDFNLLIDGFQRLIYGGLNPDTFFLEPGSVTRIRPPSGTPLEIRGGSPEPHLLNHLRFETQSGGDSTYAASVDDTPVIIEHCVFDVTQAGSGTALRLTGSGAVTLVRSTVRGGSDVQASAPDHAAGILVEGDMPLTVRNCFVSGGFGRVSSSGIDVNTTGAVAIGLNTISAGHTGLIGNAAAIRLRAGRPAVGGNILFTRGDGVRPAVIEEAADADPSWFEANLILDVSQPVYKNNVSDGPDADDEGDLNHYNIVGDSGVTQVGNNRLEVRPPTELLEDVFKADYHLVSPPRSGASNPAVNSMPRLFGGTRYGLDPTTQPLDIDGESRPGSYSSFDRGADELP